MERTEMLRALRLFNEKTEQLSSERFSRFVFEQESGVTMRGAIDKPIVVERRGPDQEAIKAFVLTLRFFLQDNEPCSLRNIAKIYDIVLISSELRESFQEARRNLNNYLDSETFHAKQNKRLTNREILETFVYGGLAHANSEKKALYDSWMAYRELSEFFWNTLVIVFAKFMSILVYIHDLNAEVMVAMGEIP